MSSYLECPGCGEKAYSAADGPWQCEECGRPMQQVKVQRDSLYCPFVRRTCLEEKCALWVVYVNPAGGCCAVLELARNY